MRANGNIVPTVCDMADWDQEDHANRMQHLPNRFLPSTFVKYYANHDDVTQATVMQAAEAALLSQEVASVRSALAVLDAGDRRRRGVLASLVAVLDHASLPTLVSALSAVDSRADTQAVLDLLEATDPGRRSLLGSFLALVKDQGSGSGSGHGSLVELASALSRDASDADAQALLSLLPDPHEAALVEWMVHTPLDTLTMGDLEDLASLCYACPDAGRAVQVVDHVLHFNPSLATLVAIAGDVDDTDRSGHVLFDAFSLGTALADLEPDGLVRMVIQHVVRGDDALHVIKCWQTWKKAARHRHVLLVEVLETALVLGPLKLDDVLHFLMHGKDQGPDAELVRVVATSILLHTPISLKEVIDLGKKVSNRAELYLFLRRAYRDSPEALRVVLAATTQSTARWNIDLIDDLSTLRAQGVDLTRIL